MIIHLNKNTPKNIIKDIQLSSTTFINEKNDYYQIVNSSKNKSPSHDLAPYIIDQFIFDNDIQIASIAYESNRIVSVNNLQIGRDSSNFAVIMGPCSIESEEQMDKTARFLSKLNLNCIRGGTYKPRTSPYSFQGLESKGLKILQNTGTKNNLTTFSEAKDATHIQEVIEHANVIQVGAKSMYDHGILNTLGKSNKPVLLKRGFSTTLQEFVQAAEFILCRGNEKVILCERGIRTFENNTRFTLDLCGVSWLKEHTNLPIIIDPSHALGYRYGIKDLSKAAIAMGIDGLLIEVHPNPENALSDANQQLNFEEANELIEAIKPYLEIERKQMI